MPFEADVMELFVMRRTITIGIMLYYVVNEFPYIVIAYDRQAAVGRGFQKW